ncbi:MAG: FAD-dependent oxidoreductase [Candidatus Diapherotrites archaeon]|uniref:FAD-dependent oxidoreductase n=1 Tax=Candidatus Iainarchaeum sp. TaxID=3101447 RepID=A0A8T3YLB3_9ARCH|nr:FAD-dependent oxidoreductase [Candidatus Diapherotrites archaeon]
MEEYDFLIIGAGSAGLPAAIYAARFRLKTLVIGELPGGTITQTHVVENWPGVISATGLDLMDTLMKHVNANGVEVLTDKVVSVEKKGDFFFIVKTAEGKVFKAKTILFATGTSRKKLNIPGEKEFDGKGVSWCAVCDGVLFKNKVVAVIGGSDSAAKEALFLAEHASKVYIIHRGDKIRPEPINGERVKANRKIELVLNKNVSQIFGEKFVKGVKFKEGGQLSLDGVFIEIGATANSDLAKKIGVKADVNGEIIIDEASRTNVPGVYAAGDVANRHFKQAITGAAEGVVAAFSAYEDINAPAVKKGK